MSSEKRRDPRCFESPSLAPVPFPTRIRSPESSVKQKAKVRQIFRDRRFGTTACPGCRAMGTRNVKKVCGEGKIFCTGLTRSVKAG
jgi:hypothetical protein